ncbi:MAG: DUF1460 domain-containing protein [Candidatus Eisenbacteria bacterium]|nr:DUF1460 domain-containing protein [Candidatus Eisenbacteria bacterium]
MIAAALLGLCLGWTSGYPLLYEAPPERIDALLRDPHWTVLGVEEKLAALARLRIHTPYRIGCLGEGRDPDRDPLFRLDETDCTVLVVTSAALLHAGSLEEAEGAIRRIHYRGGQPSYENRYHFTLDRITASPFFEEITARAAPDSLLEGITVRLNRDSAGGRLLPIDWEREVTIRYLPARRMNRTVAARLPSACGIAFLRLANVPKGYLVAHEGILLDGDRLFHASSRAGRVVESPLFDYLENTGFDGLLFYRFL